MASSCALGLATNMSWPWYTNVPSVVKIWRMCGEVQVLGWRVGWG